jgi:hypothetical protein
VVLAVFVAALGSDKVGVEGIGTQKPAATPPTSFLCLLLPCRARRLLMMNGAGANYKRHVFPLNCLLEGVERTGGGAVVHIGFDFAVAEAHPYLGTGGSEHRRIDGDVRLAKNSLGSLAEGSLAFDIELGLLKLCDVLRGEPSEHRFEWNHMGRYRVGVS